MGYIQNIFRGRLYTVVGIAVIIVSSVLLLLNPVLIPSNFSDISFHLTVANLFIDADGVTLWNYFEAAPIGRAQLYPPFFHIVITLFLKLGFTKLFIVKFFSFIIYPFILFSLWYVAKKLFNDRVALLAVLLLAHVLQFIFSATMLIPATFVLALTLIGYVALVEKKYAALFFLLVVMWYSHMILPFFSVFLFLCYGATQRTELKKIILICGASFILYLPWLIHIINNVEYIKYFSGLSPFERGRNESRLDMLLPLVFLLSMVANVIYFFKNQFFQKTLPFLLWLIPHIPIIFYYPERFFDSSGLIIFSLSTAVFLYLLFTHFRFIVIRVLLGIVVLTVLSIELLVVFNNAPQPILEFGKSTFFALLSPGGQQHAREEYNPYNEYNLEFANAIATYSNADDIIWIKSTVFEHYQYSDGALITVANFFGSMANRAIANARDPESYRPDLWQPLPIEQAQLVYVELKQTPYWDQERSEQNAYIAEILENQFVLVEQNEIFFLYKNKNPKTATIQPVAPVMPLWIAHLLLLLLIVMIFWSYKKSDSINALLRL